VASGACLRLRISDDGISSAAAAAATTAAAAAAAVSATTPAPAPAVSVRLERAAPNGLGPALQLLEGVARLPGAGAGAASSDGEDGGSGGGGAGSVEVLVQWTVGAQAAAAALEQQWVAEPATKVVLVMRVRSGVTLFSFGFDDVVHVM
jgi:hypothetical protein